MRPASPTADLTHWLKKVQFKLHETYANSSRMVESPPFEVTESGWGEFEVQIKLFFVPEANEKAQTLWHALKLHPFGEGAEGVRERRESVVSQCYEEVLFSEPVEPFYEILTQGAQGGRGGKGGGGKGSKQVAVRKGGERSAEIQARPSEGFPYSEKTEGEEIDRLRGAIKEVERLVEVEEGKLEWKEAEMEGLRRKGMV